MAENEGKKEKGKGGKGGGKGGKGGKGKGGEGAKAQLPKLLKSDDVTGQYKEAIIVQRGDMPEPYQQAFNNAWNAVRMNKEKQFREAVEQLIATSRAETAPLDVHCDKAKITFGDPEKKVEHQMCLLAWCGFQCRLDFAQHLIERGASIDSGNSEVGSPLLQMMVLHDARPGAGSLSIDTLKFFTEDHRSVLSRVISTVDQPVTLFKATVLTVALHMKRVDIAQYLFTEHKLHPIFCGSRDYPPIFLEYIEYGTFEFIPWLLTEGYDSPDEIVQFTDEVFRPEVQRAGLGEGGELRPGGLMEAAARNDRSVAHAVLLCANRRGINMLTKKRPDLIEVVDSCGRTALYIAAEAGFQKPVNILCDKCSALINIRDKSGVLPIMAAAKAGHKRAVERLLYHMLKDDALNTRPAVADEIRYSSLSALSYGFYAYFDAFHCDLVCAYEVAALNLRLDNMGNTAAHVAAMKGREDTFKALLPAATDKMMAVLTMKNGEGKTPLQLAVDKGHSGLFETLPAKSTEFCEAWRPHNDALLLYACVHGNVETVAAVMQLNSSAQIRSPKGRTPLSCAAEAGNNDVVGFLLSCQFTTSDGTVLYTSPEGSGVPEYNPLLLAARNGHAKVCRKLLDKRASVNTPRDDKTNFTPLMVAIDEGNREVVITILSDEAQGLEAMRVCVEKPRLCQDRETEADITSPMRMLIEEMPDVAEWMMNRSINCCSGDRGDESGESPIIEYSFQFLEDFQEECQRLPVTVKRFLTLFRPPSREYRPPVPGPASLDLGNGKGTDEGGKKEEEAESTLVTTPTSPVATETASATAVAMDSIFEETSSPSVMPVEVAEAEGLLTRPSHATTNKWGPILYNRDHHPLHIMVKHKRADLLKHPLVSRLLEYKWRKVALPLFLAYITLYLLFLILLTLFALLSPRPSPGGDTCVLESRGSGTTPNKTNGTCNGLDVAREDYLHGSSVFLILLSIFYLSVEAVQVIRRRKQYLTEGENYVQVLTFLFSMIFVSGFGNECWCAPSWQWQIGALALFLAWFNLIILLKDMPFTGIPINMLFNICLTFVGLVFLPVLLIIAFALPFYMLFVRDRGSQDDAGTLTAFFNPSRAIAKTVMQTVGELDFETIFNDGDLLFSPSAYLLFFTFVVVMPVLFSNLLVGLAVGDTAEEKDKATFTRTRLQVEFILELEAMSVFLRGQMRPPDNRRRYFKKVGKLRQMYLRMMGLSYSTQVELVKDLREKDEDFVDSALKEKGPTHELQMRVESLGVKTVKVEEDVRVVREEVGGVEGRLGERLQGVEKGLSEIKALLEQLVKSKTKEQYYSV